MFLVGLKHLALGFQPALSPGQGGLKGKVHPKDLYCHSGPSQGSPSNCSLS